MLTQPLVGATYLFNGMRMLVRPALLPYVLIPLTINVVLFGLLLWWFGGEFGALVDRIVPVLPEWLAWLYWLLWLFFAVTAAIILFFTFTLVANWVGAPFNGLLAEAVERELSGQGPGGGSLWQALRDTPQALRDELAKLLYFLIWAVPLGVLFLIPGVNLAAPLLWALFSAWLLALEYLDFPLGNHGLRFSDQRRLLRGRPLPGLGFGFAVLLATLIPVVNLFVMPAAVAGATQFWLEQLKGTEHAERR